MKPKYILTEEGVKNSLEMLYRKDGNESKTFIVKTSSSIVRTGKLEDGSAFLDLSGGPMIIVGKPLKEAENNIVRSIDLSEQLGYTITFV